MFHKQNCLCYASQKRVEVNPKSPLIVYKRETLPMELHREGVLMVRLSGGHSRNACQAFNQLRTLLKRVHGDDHIPILINFIYPSFYLVIR